ncbi:MAG: hypothetical protein U0M02_06030 [Acutalibacteraceae bacterium]|nr:hypothetical protein [Acutalibacteraceae bacterium]
MARCPKCNRKLHIWNVKAECPDCGVNIANYDWENRLEQDSIEAEAAFAKLHETMRKFKYSFVGTKLRIARIPISVLPLFTFLLPLGTLAVSIPFCDEKITINAITLVMNIMNFDILGIFKAPASDIIGDTALMFMLSILFVVLSALSLLVSLVFLMLNFRKFNSKGLFGTNLVASLMMFASAFCFHQFSAMMEASTLADAIQCGPSWGVFVSGAIFLVSSITNLIVSLQKVEIPPEETRDETETKEEETANV